MGDGKDAMTPKTEAGKNVFGKFKDRAKRSADKPQDFADKIADAYQDLNSLIAKKESDLSNEKGRENYNSRALARLKTMHFHLEQIIDQGYDYSQDS